MPNDTVIKLIQPGTFTTSSPMFCAMGRAPCLTQAVEAEVAEFSGHACRSQDRGWPSARRAPRPSARARGHDRHRPGRRAPAARARP